MIVASLHLLLRLQASSSLKEKRRVLSSVKARLTNRFNLSIAEIGNKESWTEAELGIAVVAEEKALADRVLDRVTRFLDADGRLEVVHRVVEYF